MIGPGRFISLQALWSHALWSHAFPCINTLGLRCHLVPRPFLLIRLLQHHGEQHALFAAIYTAKLGRATVNDGRVFSVPPAGRSCMTRQRNEIRWTWKQGLPAGGTRPALMPTNCSGLGYRGRRQEHPRYFLVPSAEIGRCCRRISAGCGFFTICFQTPQRITSPCLT